MERSRLKGTRTPAPPARRGGGLRAAPVGARRGGLPVGPGQGVILKDLLYYPLARLGRASAASPRGTTSWRSCAGPASTDARGTRLVAWRGPRRAGSPGAAGRECPAGGCSPPPGAGAQHSEACMKREARALAARSGFACAKANSSASSSSYYIAAFPPAYAFYGRYVVVVPREV